MKFLKTNKRFILLVAKWLSIFILLLGIVTALDAIQKSKNKIWVIEVLSTELPLFNNIEALAIIAGLIALALDTPNQQKKSHYEAWQVISLAQGHSGSGGRIQAMQDLVEDEVSLAGLIAKNAYLKEINLPGAILKGANLENSKLNESNLSGADLSDANLRGTDFSSANLSGANLSGADLNGVNFSGADIRNVTINSETKLDAKWHLVWKILNQHEKAYRRKIENTDLSGADLSGVNLNNTYITKSNLSNTNLSNINLNGAFLYNNNLSDANLSGANLNSVRLDNANLSNANLSSANLHGANLSDADLSGANLRDANLSDANFYGAYLYNTNLSNANLSSANLNRAKFWDNELGEAQNITLKQIKQAKNWKKGIYSPTFCKKLGFPLREIYKTKFRKKSGINIKLIKWKR
ncbi:MAG: pentapeptide repeat-containing protein [Cyanobacteria bacterium P01_H01_bin.150]